MKTNGNFQMGTKVVRVISGPAATWYAPATVVEVLEDGDFVLDHMPSRRWSPRGDYAVTAEDEVEVERVVVWTKEVDDQIARQNAMRRNSARVARFHAWLEDKQLGTEYYLSDAQVALLERVMEMEVEP